MSYDCLGATGHHPSWYVCEITEDAQWAHADCHKVWKSNRLSQELNVKWTHQYSWDKFLPTLDAKNMILAPFCERKECEEKIKADSTKEFASVYILSYPLKSCVCIVLLCWWYVGSVSFEGNSIHSWIWQLKWLYSVSLRIIDPCSCCSNILLIYRIAAEPGAPAMGAKSLCIPFEQPALAAGAKVPFMYYIDSSCHDY